MKKRCALVFVATLPLAMQAAGLVSLGDIARRLSSYDSYADSCSYEVYLPSLSDPVCYGVRLYSASNQDGDTLAPCRYLIEWSLSAPDGVVEGFSAYADGAHYRFRDKRLQEYHTEWDSVPFAPGGRVRAGVQNQVQFAELLPQYMGRKFSDMVSDSTYVSKVTTDTVVGGRKSLVVSGRRRVNGYDAAEYVYVLDPDSFLPRLVELENNPGQLGEQSISVRYMCGSERPCDINAETLAARYPDAFGKYRESSFSLENLPGKPMPRVVAPTTTGERYLHEKGEPFAVPTVFVFMESAVGSCGDVVRAVREAVDYLPMGVDVIWAFFDHRVDDIEAVVPSIRPGEHLLMNARGAASDCGVGADTPVLVFVGADGVVRDFVQGYNQDLKSIVIQKASLSN